MRRILSLLMIVFLLVSLPACSLLPGVQHFQQNSGQNDSDNDSDDADEDDEEDDDNSDYDSDNDSGGSMAVGSDWPKDLTAVPEFTYGKIITVVSMTETYDGIDFSDYNITFENADMGAGEDYAADLEKAGFEPAYEPYEWEDRGETYIQYDYEMYAFETEDTLYYISVDFWLCSDETGAVFVSVPEDPGPNGVQSGSSEDDDSSYEMEYDDGESEFNWGTLSESDIPEGYPHSDVPLFGIEDGELLGASKQDMGGEGTAYIIVFGINEDVQSVADMIGSQLEAHVMSNGGSFQAILTMFMGDINNCSYTVAVGDGSSDGFTSIVDYTVIVT